jgi:hypothetical protein
MTRRNFVQWFSATALLSLSVIAFVTGAEAAQRTIVYISATNCSYCRQWEATYQKDFQAKCAAKGIRFREVRVNYYNDIREPTSWKGDLAPLLSKFKSKGGTPRFLVVDGGKVTANVFRISNWRAQILPLVQ